MSEAPEPPRLHEETKTWHRAPVEWTVRRSFTQEVCPHLSWAPPLSPFPLGFTENRYADWTAPLGTWWLQMCGVHLVTGRAVSWRARAPRL